MLPAPVGPRGHRPSEQYLLFCSLYSGSTNDPLGPPRICWSPTTCKIIETADWSHFGHVGRHFVDVARRPAQPGLPTVRAFQRSYADALLPWLKGGLANNDA
jgi:hypothetical protein